ncbi:hypothetical protein AFL01nite_02230 [Aeromicrobium flavum]|uniref:Uncharacterized protein n=1 Tax=Aeromicrobium flavum TaxID=416568 RepID=A0A512HR36_9ACTN|nr:gamma-glutamyl-gamma-aminobutyrate hydrolase family protein [Aeromicrobium flavum]GEO87896.1 hypothetical protein AFL01nite_02230 [Aeromicrobium flavum]
MSIEVRVEEVMPERSAASPIAHIGVLVSLNFPDMTEETADLVRRFTRVSLRTLVEVGASFELLDTSTPLPDPSVAARFDGLLLLGGGDIDASCYGGPTDGPVPHSYGIDARADHDAFAAIEAAEAADRPVFGICRGSQLINVHRGGTIIPDIEDYGLHRGGPGEPMFLDEKIEIEPGTRLRAILGADSTVGRSGHHQAVDVVGTGLVAAARALDGTVEGVEDPERWTLGVQWHPEDDDGPADARLQLFGSFVEACAAARHGESVRD